MNREQTSEIIALISDRHINAARCAPGATSEARKKTAAARLPRVRRPLLIAAVVALLVALGVTAYAVDLAGFRQVVQVWRSGERRQAELWDTDRDGVYALVFPDGEQILISGSKGSADGLTVPLSAEENLELLENNFDIQRDAEGRIWFCFRDEKREITDQFDESGTAVVTWDRGQQLFRYRVESKGDGFELQLLNPLEDLLPVPFQVRRDAAGRIWLCLRDEKREITDQFDESGAAVVTWEKDGQSRSYRVEIRGDGFDVHLLTPLSELLP